MLQVSLQHVILLLTTLATVIGALWALIRLFLKREQTRLDKCEQEHAEARKKITDLTGNMRYLEGRMDGVEKLSRAVLDKLEPPNQLE